MSRSIRRLSVTDISEKLEKNRITEMSCLAPKWIRLAPNGSNHGLFKDQFQYILANRTKIYCNWYLKIHDMSHSGQSGPLSCQTCHLFFSGFSLNTVWLSFVIKEKDPNFLNIRDYTMFEYNVFGFVFQLSWITAKL